MTITATELPRPRVVKDAAGVWRVDTGRTSGMPCASWRHAVRFALLWQHMRWGTR
ncbi:MAG: hypothetical protein QM582_09460 [Micropruina sp.]|uniref:hypothetical protein n=1 Tax=Micropruina sp. TaxID=2737536 RepID=UPI0039E35895